MIKYISRRLFISLIVLIGVAAIMFGLLHVIAPSPGKAILGMNASPAAVRVFDQQHGYDRSLPVQFVSYLGQLARGNLGYSYKLSQSVSALIGENLGRSAYLSGAAMLLALLVAIPVGIFQAVRRNGISDYTATTITFVLYSMPSFLLGLILIDVFALKLGWFPFEASQSSSTIGVILDVHAMVLPIVTLAAIQIASFSRYMRSSALENLAQDYIRLAKAKGLRDRQVLFGHLLRNSSLPLITLVGLSLPALLAGNVLIETLFNYPGLGLLFYNALQGQDYPVLLALALMGGAMVIVGNLAADVASSLADPRIRL